MSKQCGTNLARFFANKICRHVSGISTTNIGARRMALKTGPPKWDGRVAVHSNKYRVVDSFAGSVKAVQQNS
jgi:hypothetical protein